MDRITIDISDLCKELVYRNLIGAYKKGHDEILVLFNNPETPDLKTKANIKTIELINEIVTQMIGMEIIKSAEKKCLIKQISLVSEFEFDNVLRRIFLLVDSMAKEILSAIKSNNHNLLSNMNVKFNVISKFVNYCLRLLNKKGHRDFHKTALYYQTICGLNEISEVYYYISQEIMKNKPRLDNRALKIFEEVNDSFYVYYNLFHKFSPDLCRELIKKRREVFQQINAMSKNSNVESVTLLNRLAVVVVKILHLTETAISMNIKQKNGYQSLDKHSG